MWLTTSRNHKPWSFINAPRLSFHCYLCVGVYFSEWGEVGGGWGGARRNGVWEWSAVNYFDFMCWKCMYSFLLLILLKHHTPQCIVEPIQWLACLLCCDVYRLYKSSCYAFNSVLYGLVLKLYSRSEDSWQLCWTTRIECLKCNHLMVSLCTYISTQ